MAARFCGTACLSEEAIFSWTSWENVPGVYNKGHRFRQGTVPLNLCFDPQGPGAKLHIGWDPEIREDCGVNVSNLEHWALCP